MASNLRSRVSSKIYNFFCNKPISFIVLLLAISVVAITVLGIHRASRSMSKHAPSANSAKLGVSAKNGTNGTQSAANLPLTKLREYVHAGGRLLLSEEKSCVPSLTPASASLPQDGGTGSINFSTPSGCNWVAGSNAGWITINSGSSGTGNGTVSYSVSGNTGIQRSSTISINGQAFTITQAPSPSSCSYSLNKNSESISEQGGSGALTLTTGAGCPWTASSNVGWLSITSAISGNGSATINYSVASNSGQQHSGTITVGGQSFTVTQAPLQSSCSFSLSPGNQQFGVGSGSGSFNVSTGAGCRWDAATGDGWITITGGATGIGNGTVSFNVQTNNGGVRTGVLSVRGQNFTVTQCGYQISPNNETFGWSGGTGTITVSSTGGCSWSASSNNPWITITSGANGSGTGSVNYQVGEFYVESSGRQGSITIAGAGHFYIQQDGLPPTSCCDTPPYCMCDLAQSKTLNQSATTNTGQRGLTARYFSNTTLSGQPTLQRIDPIINFNWNSKTQNATPQVNYSSVRWSGQLAIPSSEAYTFYLQSDAGAKLWINDQLVIDRWQPPFGSQTISASIDLKAGTKVNIRLEYYNPQGNVVISSLWSSKSTPKQIIPKQYLYPEESTNQSSLTGADQQIGMLLPPNSDSWPKTSQIQPSIQHSELALFFTLLIAFIVRSKALRRFVIKASSCVRRVITRKVITPINAFTANILKAFFRALLSLTPVFRRILAIVIIVILIFPQTQAQVKGLSYAAQSIWQNVNDVVKYSINAASSKRYRSFFSVAVQSEQVANLQICPKQLIMYVGERYTLTPIPLNSTQSIVHGVSIQFNSLSTTIAKVTSFGEIEAFGVGNTTIEVQSGNVSKQVPIEVRTGTRPVGSNQEADLDSTADCNSEQPSMSASQSIADTDTQQSAMTSSTDGVLLDWDPDPITDSQATHFSNAVGNPRFSAKNGGTQLSSSNYQFNVPVVSVGGRGISASIGMSFNSRVWNADDGKMTFNYVGAYPAPGWSMGYGKIIRNYNATDTGNKSGVGHSNNPGDYLLITGAGTRVRLVVKYNSATDRWFHESEDGSFLQFNPTSGEMRHPDGSRMIYSSVNGALLPTAIINTNGAVITMTYRDYCEGSSCLRVFRHRTALSAVRDTLGRYVTFHYYGDIDYPADAANGKPAGELAAIKAPNMNGEQQEVIRVEYQSITLKYDFGSIGVDAPANNSLVQVVRRIYYPQTGRGYLFQDYSSYGMPRKISSRMAMTGAVGVITNGTEIAYTKYNYTTIDPNDPYGRNQAGSLDDFPQFTRKEEWWLGKTDANDTPTTTTAKYDYSRTTNSSTEITTIKHVDKNYEEVTTTGTDSSQLSYGKVISTEAKNSTTGVVLSKQIYSYAKGPDGEEQIEKVETIDEAGQGMLSKMGYGHFGRVIDRYEYGYKQAGNYQVRRRTHYDYIDDQSYITERFLGLVSRVSVYDAKNNNDDTDDELKGKIETIFDDYASMGGQQNYGLSANIYPPNHDAAYNQNKVLRGNATGIKTFSKITPEESTTRRVKFDIFGNVIEAKVNCCVKKSFSFNGMTAYSQPYAIRSGGEAGLSLETTYQYNYFTGLVLNETSPDGLLTDYEYDGALRLKKVTSPTGVVATTQFEQDSYANDLLTYINQTIYDDQDVQKIITSKQWFDGVGQIIKAGTGAGSIPDSFDMTMTIHDDWGRVLKSSNPYAGDANGDAQGGVTQFWTTNTYDELSRVTKITLPDNQFIETTYSGATATSGATVAVTDTARRKRKSEADGLGRLVKVTEPNPANGTLEWETAYSYDVMNNLIQINQGGQIRSFTHDAKGRIVSQTLPESGTTAYTYTDFDAVKTRTDARGVVTTYDYGSLNFLIGVNHNTSNAIGVAATPSVNIIYKNTSPGKGRIETVTDGTGSESYSYDRFSRLQSSTQLIDGRSYEKQYEYNTVGQATSMTYPSGKRVKLARDSRGRLSTIQRVDASNNLQETYLSDINYRVDGLISSQKIGDSTTENFGYSNDRLQLTSQTVTKGSNTLLNLNYGYEASAGQMGNNTTSGNTGQLVSISGTVNGQNRNQTFTYDNVGRLAAATGWGSWARRFDYDRQGNRTAVWDTVSGGNQLQSTALAQVGGTPTNRIASVTTGTNVATYSYDASGSLISDGTKTLAYDALNRIVSVRGLISENYSYDAANHRVKKESGGVVTHYIWEGDQVIAEYEYGGSNTPAKGTRYHHQDRLSTRFITDNAGNIVGMNDHLPFGEEIGGSGELGKHKYTSYQRDETGLDYAVNRYYINTQGRFMQVDPIGMASVNIGDPQSLNLYAYCANDPINSTDSSGLAPGDYDLPQPEGSDGKGGNYGAFGGSGGGFGGRTCTLDGLQASCGMVLNASRAGSAVPDVKYEITYITWNEDGTVGDGFTSISSVSGFKEIFKIWQDEGYRIDGNHVYDIDGNIFASFYAIGALNDFAQAVFFSNGGLVDQAKRALPVVQGMAVIPVVLVAPALLPGGAAVFLEIGEIPPLIGLGLGSTGRTVAANLIEQMAMSMAKLSPGIGTTIIKSVNDSRWQGWSKMEYKVKSVNGVNAVVHYVAKFTDGVITAVDDFKFK